jgi:hypothetical protein
VFDIAPQLKVQTFENNLQSSSSVNAVNRPISVGSTPVNPLLPEFMKDARLIRGPTTPNNRGPIFYTYANEGAANSTSCRSQLELDPENPNSIQKS